MGKISSSDLVEDVFVNQLQLGPINVHFVVFGRSVPMMFRLSRSPAIYTFGDLEALGDAVKMFKKGLVLIWGLSRGSLKFCHATSYSTIPHQSSSRFIAIQGWRRDIRHVFCPTKAWDQTMPWPCTFLTKDDHPALRDTCAEARWAIPIKFRRRLTTVRKGNIDTLSRFL